MSEEPIFGGATELIWIRLPEHFRNVDAENNWTMKRYLSGLLARMDDVFALIQRFSYTSPEDGEGYRSADLVDPTKADKAWLGWLAQLLGTKSLGSGGADPSAYAPGTLSNISAAAATVLTGDKYVRAAPFRAGGNPGGIWDLTLFTRNSETLKNVIPEYIATATNTSVLQGNIDHWYGSVPATSYGTKNSLVATKDPDWYRGSVGYISDDTPIDDSNMVRDPGFLTGSTGFWSNSNQKISFVPDSGPLGETTLQIETDGNQNGLYYNSSAGWKALSVVAGMTYYISVWIKSSVDVTSSGWASVYLQHTSSNNTQTFGEIVSMNAGTNGTPQNMHNKNQIDADKWFKLEGKFTVPVDTTHSTFGLFTEGAATGGVMSYSRPVIHPLARLTIEGGDNLVPNGSLDTSQLAPWSSVLSINTQDKPDGLPASLQAPQGQGAVSFVNGENSWLDVVPDTDYVVEMWLKADRPGSVFYLELLDQNYNFAGAVKTPTTPIAGTIGTGLGPYLVTQRSLNTEWTHYSAIFKMNSEASKVRLGTAHFNHADGSETGAVQMIAGLSIKPSVTVESPSRYRVALPSFQYPSGVGDPLNFHFSAETDGDVGVRLEIGNNVEYHSWPAIGSEKRQYSIKTQIEEMNPTISVEFFFSKPAKIGEFGARLEPDEGWVPVSASPVKAVIDMGAKPAGMQLHHALHAPSWDVIEAARPVWNDWEGDTWNEIEETEL